MQARDEGKALGDLDLAAKSERMKNLNVFVENSQVRRLPGAQSREIAAERSRGVSKQCIPILI